MRVKHLISLLKQYDDKLKVRVVSEIWGNPVDIYCVKPGKDKYEEKQEAHIELDLIGKENDS